MIIGKRIKELSKNKQVSVIDLAKHLEISTTAIYDIFKKDKISTDILEKIKEILNISMTDFFIEDKEKNLLVGDNNFSKQKNSNNTTVNDIEAYKKEIEHLNKELLKAKDKIIQLLENK